MPERRDGTSRRSVEGLISHFVVLLRNGVARPRDWWRLRTRRRAVVKQREKLASAPVNRLKLRTQSDPAREQYVAPTREQRVALCE